MRKIILSLLAAMLLLGLAGATYTTMTPVSLTDPNDWSRMTAAWTTILGNGSTCNFAVDGAYDYFLLVNVTSWDITDPTVDVLNIMAGANPPAFRSGIGNLPLPLPDLLGPGTGIVGPLESARFMNSSGYVNVGSYMVSGKMAVLEVT
jgi:hypothetical protein